MTTNRTPPRPKLFLRVELAGRYFETGRIEQEQPQPEPPVVLPYPMNVYAPPVGFIHPEDER